MIVKNTSGFTTVFLLLTLPALMALLALIYSSVVLIELKNEFRFKCIHESLKLQTELSNDNKDSLKEATELLQNLNNIISPVQFSVTLSDYPKRENQNLNSASSALVYELNYKWMLDFYLKCGVKQIKKDNKWHYEIVYSTKKDKF